MNVPENLKYSKSHEWVRVEGNVAYIGITDHAQHELGDIVYVEVPEVEEELSKGDEATSIESVKAAAPIYTPVSGEIVKVNDDLDEKPELINQNAFEAFIYAVELSDPSELDVLMDAEGYKKMLEND